MKSSIVLEMVVARATPAMPSFGAENKPKIKTAFKKMFRSRAVVVITVTIFTRSMLLNAA